jgi:phospholipase/carboxylesterase
MSHPLPSDYLKPPATASPAKIPPDDLRGSCTEVVLRHDIHHGSSLEYLVLTPDDSEDDIPLPLLIWLHGFGADKNDLANLATAVHPSGYRQVLPNAPLGGFGGPEGTVRAWYERGGRESRRAVQDAVTGLDAFVQEILTRFRVPTKQALLLGFSQGGALALRYGLPRPPLFAGLAALSGSLRQADDLREDLPADKEQAIFLAHGVDDQMVPVEWGRRVAEVLHEEGFSPVYQEYPMGHEISPSLITALTRWITKTLPPTVPG